LVAACLDASAERIINYLSQKYHVQINAVFFQYARLGGEKEILARAMLVAEEAAPKPKSSKRRPTIDELIKAATDQGTETLVDICRGVRSDLWEEAVSTYDGSFRYWGESKAGQSRMVFGVNVAAKFKPPQGQLDVWITPLSVSEVTDRSENDVRAALEKQQPIVADIHAGFKNPCWIRLKTVEEAQALVQQLREFLTPQ